MHSIKVPCVLDRLTNACPTRKQLVVADQKASKVLWNLEVLLSRVLSSGEEM